MLKGLLGAFDPRTMNDRLTAVEATLESVEKMLDGMSLKLGLTVSKLDAIERNAESAHREAMFGHTAADGANEKADNIAHVIGDHIVDEMSRLAAITEVKNQVAMLTEEFRAFVARVTVPEPPKPITEEEHVENVVRLNKKVFERMEAEGYPVDNNPLIAAIREQGESLLEFKQFLVGLRDRIEVGLVDAGLLDHEQPEDLPTPSERVLGPIENKQLPLPGFDGGAYKGDLDGDLVVDPANGPDVSVLAVGLRTKDGVALKGTYVVEPAVEVAVNIMELTKAAREAGIVDRRGKPLMWQTIQGMLKHVKDVKSAKVDENGRTLYLKGAALFTIRELQRLLKAA